MASLRTWRTVAGTLLVLVVLATSTSATAEATTPGHQQAHYCKQVDAYRLKTCAKALLPAGPLGPALQWVLARLAGEAATLTEAEARRCIGPRQPSPSGEPAILQRDAGTNRAQMLAHRLT
jgi:hypothetical protein